MGERHSTHGTPSLTAVPERIARDRVALPRRVLLRGADDRSGVAAGAIRDPGPPLAADHYRAAARPELSARPFAIVRPTAEQPSPEVALEELERVLASSDFDGTPRSRAFLRFVLHETLDGRQDALTQPALATHVFERRQDFDPTIDPIVRIQAGRLRRSLERYYLLGGARDPVRIELPRGGYVPLVKWASHRESGGDAERGSSRKLDDWPSVVVGPFRTDSSDWRTDDAALRFCERLAFEIGRYGDVRVALRSELDKLEAPPSDGGRFVLSGHLSGHEATGGGAIARLVDARVARQVWAEEFHAGVGRAGSHDDVARLIAARVASEHGVVARTLRAERRGRTSIDPTPYNAILRSYQFLLDGDVDDLVAALESLQQVVGAEPDCGPAWVQLGRLCTENYACEVSPVQTPIERAVSCAHQGTRLEPLSQRARAVLAHALFVQGELAASRVEALKALDLEPRSFANLDTLGWLLTLQGDGERGPALVREAMALNPNHSPIVFQALWADHLRRDEIEQSRQVAFEFHDRWSFWPALMRACSLGHLGRVGEAGDEIGELLGRKPDFPRRGRALIGRLIRLPELFERVRQGLEKAGLALD